jgi:hypothetical protein
VTRIFNGLLRGCGSFEPVVWILLSELGDLELGDLELGGLELGDLQ